jgi:hypothetical protein
MEQILPQVQEKVGGVDNLPKKERLPFIQRIMCDLFENETEEIKAVVEAKIKELRMAAESDDDAISLESYQQCVPV